MTRTDPPGHSRISGQSCQALRRESISSNSEKRLKDLALGEQFLWPAQPRRRMDLIEAGERLAQIHTSAALPDDPYGACHPLTLD